MWRCARSLEVRLPIAGDSERSAAIPGCIGCRLEACATKRDHSLITNGVGLARSRLDARSSTCNRWCYSIKECIISIRLTADERRYQTI